MTGLRRRLSLVFAAAVAAALVLFGGAIIGVLELQAHDDAHDAEDREDAAQVVRRVLFAMAVLLPAGALGAGALGSVLAERALRPLREASRRARAAQGADGLDLALPETGAGDEWDELARTLNALLRDARSGLLRIRRFTADAAHELRTPLTAMIGEAEVTLRRERTAPELRASLEIVKSEAQRLATLVEALLSLARADEGTLLSGGAAVDLAALGREAVARVQARAAARSVIVETSGACGPVRGNPVLLSRLFDNLLDNAVRHARARVLLAISAEGAQAQVRVSDDGPGISAELRPVLFERFVRGTSSRSEPGFGLGLAIARAVAEAHGGALRLGPREAGAEFVLELPAA